MDSEMPMKTCIIINESDNVATVLSTVAVNDLLSVLDTGMHEIGLIRATTVIPFGHKISLGNIPKGSGIIKFGEIIGLTRDYIPIGSHVHVHNVQSIMGTAGKPDRSA